MKKFSKVKYFGAVAAALLAVAPIAAPVVSQVASPAVVQAATATGDAQWAKALDNVFTDSATVSTKTAKASTFYNGVDTAYDPAVTPDGATLLGSFLRQGTSAALNGVKLSVSFTDFANDSADNLAQELPASSKTSFQVTIKAVDANDSSKTLASKVVTLNVGTKSSVAVTAGEGTVTGSTSSVVTPSSMAAATKMTDRDGNAISLSGADFEFMGWNNDPSASVAVVNYLPTGSAVFGDNTAVANTSGTAFANPGTSYVVFKIPGATKSAKYSTVNFTDLNDSYTRSWTDSTTGDLWIARAVTVKTGTDDQQYSPVFKYSYAPATPVSNAQVVKYSNGQTINLNTTDAAALTFYIGSPTQSSDTANIAKQINTIYKQDGKLVAVADSNGTTTAVNYSTVDSAAVAQVITNPYKPGTYNIPVTATNAKGLSTTINIPVVINSTVGSPVAVSFTGYTEITKGDKFDPMSGIQFQNSPTDNALIGGSGIQVSSNVDTSTPGTYTVTYTVTNTSGRSATFTRTVVVKDGALTESNADGVVYINKADDATVYSDAATTKATDKTLQNTSAWKFHSVVKDATGKIVAYNLGGKQYVKASEVSTSPVKAQAGVFTVHYPANAKWSIAVYNSDLKVVKLIPAKSSWLTFGTKTLKDGKSYYNLGGNQWVRTDYGFWNAK